MIILIVIHIILLFNLQFTAWPEMFSFPYVIDNGFLIYRDFHHVYQPLLTFVLLVFYKIFGYKLITLKAVTYIIIALIDLFLFLNIKKLTKKNFIALSTLLLFVLLQPIFDGNMLWYDIAVTLPILVSIYFIEKSLFISGFFVAISFLIKQQAALLVLPFFLYLIVKKLNIREILKFIYGGLIPILFLTLFLYRNGVAADYLFWTFEFPLLHLPKIPGYSILPNLHELQILALMGFTMLIGAITNFRKLNYKFYFLLSVLFFLILSAFPRFSLFHLQPALAIYILMIGYLLTLKNKYFIIFLTPLLLLWRGTLASAKYEDRFYGQNEKNLSEKVKEISGSKKIYFLGPSSIEYVLSETLPAKPWIENYVWHFEIPVLQEKVIQGWKIDSPQYIYWTKPEKGNWYDLGAYQPDKIVDYIKNNYEKTDEFENIEVWKIKK